MKGTVAIRRCGLRLLCAGMFAVLLALACSHAAKAHLAKHQGHAAHASHVQHNTWQHDRTERHNHHHHKKDGSHCPHFHCACPGSGYCNTGAVLTSALRTATPRPFAELDSQAPVDFGLVKTDPDVPDRCGLIRAVRPPPSSGGWRRLLYSGIPRLRL